MDELEQIKLKAYKSYKRYKIGYGKECHFPTMSGENT